MDSYGAVPEADADVLTAGPVISGWCSHFSPSMKPVRFP